MSLAARIVSIFRSITIVIAIAVVFLFGVATTVYLSLRSPEVKVPDVVGKDRSEAEKILEAADLKYRVRASRPSNQTQPDTVLFQLPRAGEVVKTGQTVAMDISRPAKAGESPETVTPADEPSENRNTNASANENENKPKKPKPKNTNENANENSNSNTNSNRSTTNSNRPPANANANRPANTNSNTNRSNTNTNVNRPNANATVNVNAAPRSNVNTNTRSNVNTNTRPNNSNDNRRPVLRPTPAVPGPE